MSGIKFLSENYFDSADLSMLTGTENAQFPLENLKNDSPSVKFRGIGSTSVILIDLLETRDIDFVAVCADPLESFRITSASFRTSTTVDFSLSPVNVIALSNEQSIGYKEITEVSHRYVELTIVGSGGFTELGKVFVGQAVRLPQNSISISSFSYSYNDRSNTRSNRYGQKFIDKLNQVKSLGGTIEYCTKDEQQALDDMLLRHGESYPLWMIIDSNSDALNEGNFKLTVYGYLSGDISWSASGGQLYTTSIEINQAV